MQFALRLFRQTFEHKVRKGTVLPLPSVIPDELSKPESGVYVAAFEKPGRKPRGRVGSYLPTKSTLAEEIQMQAVQLVDTFPFRKEDLPFLTYEVLLTKSPHLLADLSELRPNAGLLVRTSRGRHGISLPMSGGQTPEERYADACKKAEINRHVDDVRMYEFDIDVLDEQDQ